MTVVTTPQTSSGVVSEMRDVRRAAVRQESHVDAGNRQPPANEFPPKRRDHDLAIDRVGRAIDEQHLAVVETELRILPPAKRIV